MNVSSAKKNCVNFTFFAVLEVHGILVKVAQSRNDLNFLGNVFHIIVHFHLSVSPSDPLGSVLVTLQSNIFS